MGANQSGEPGYIQEDTLSLKEKPPVQMGHVNAGNAV